MGKTAKGQPPAETLANARQLVVWLGSAIESTLEDMQRRERRATVDTLRQWVNWTADLERLLEDTASALTAQADVQFSDTVHAGVPDMRSFTEPGSAATRVPEKDTLDRFVRPMGAKPGPGDVQTMDAVREIAQPYNERRFRNARFVRQQMETIVAVLNGMRAPQEVTSRAVHIQLWAAALERERANMAIDASLERERKP